MLKTEKFELKYIASIKTLAERLKNRSKTESILKFLFCRSITNDEKGTKFYSGSKYYDLIVEMDAFLKGVWPEKIVEELLSNNDVDAEEYFDFIGASQINYAKFKVSCNIKKINDYLIEKFDANTILQYTEQLKIIKSDFDLSEFKSFIDDVILTKVLESPRADEVITNIYELGKILSLDGKLAFNIPEARATALLEANPAHGHNVDILLSIISANIIKPRINHTTEIECMRMLAEPVFQPSLIQSYTYYFTYSDLIKYDLQFPSTLTTGAIREITNSPNEVAGSNGEILISQYNEIKSRIFDSNLQLCNSFISKVNSFYNEGTQFVSEVNLSYITPLLSDNHSVDCNLVADIILQANHYINELTKDKWLALFREWETSEDMELFKVLEQTNNYRNSKLPQLANEAHYEIVLLVSKKELLVPTDTILWNKFFDLRAGNLVTTYKNVRDNLINPAYGDVSIEELIFFEKGLFKCGKLDENQNIADNILRRLFTL